MSDQFSPEAQLARALTPAAMRAYGIQGTVSCPGHVHVTGPGLDSPMKWVGEHVDVTFASMDSADSWRRTHVPHHTWEVPGGLGYTVRIFR